MKSSGTIQRLPIRAGAAGSDIRRPATDAMVWSGVRTIVRPLYPTVMAPPSSRTFNWNALARSSTATISWEPLSVIGMERRPSREMTCSTVWGACPARRPAANTSASKQAARTPEIVGVEVNRRAFNGGSRVRDPHCIRTPKVASGSVDDLPCRGQANEQEDDEEHQEEA